MAIAASQLVQVLPRILKATGKDLVFNGMVLDDNAALRAGVPTGFYSASEVGDYFGTESDEYSFAQVYFGGFDNSQAKPQTLFFWRLTPQPVGAWVRAAAVRPADALAALRAIGAGTITVTVGGTAHTAEDIDLTEATSLSGAAATIAEALATEGVAPVTVEWSAIRNSFTITTTDTGGQASITCPTGTVAAAMGFDPDTATLSEGHDGATVGASMNEIVDMFTNFVTFTTLAEPSDGDAMELAKWASSNLAAGVMYLYVCWDSSAANLDANSTTCVAELLRAENVGATCVAYPSAAMAAFIMGVTASIAWDQANGAITYAFKRQSGLPASVESTAAANALNLHRVTFMGNFATRNDQFILSYAGAILGEWDWIDTYVNAIWLCNAMQVQLMAMLAAAGRIPYTEVGYSKIRANMRDVTNRAINNGVIDAGVSLSEAQKAELTTLLGADYSGEIETNGYYIQVIDPSAAVRQQRLTPTINFVYTYGGAVHKLIVPATAVV